MISSLSLMGFMMVVDFSFSQGSNDRDEGKVSSQSTSLWLASGVMAS